MKIEHNGEIWEVLSEGIERKGKVFCHLASVSRGTNQANGWVPAQIGDWVASDVLLAAEIAAETRP